MGRARGTLAPALGFVLFSFALNSIMTRYIVGQGLLDPGLATAARFLAGAGSLLLLLAALRRPRDAQPGRANILPAMALGAYAVLISYGYQHIGAAAGTFVFYACVLATMTLGGWRLAPPRPVALLGSVVALAGVGVLALGRVEGATLPGVALLAGTGIAWGAYSLFARRSADPLGFTAQNFAALGIAMAAFLGALGLARAPWTWTGLGIALFMGAVTTALSYAVWYWALARIAPGAGGTYQLAIPVLTAAMGVLLLGEAFSERLLAAGALVLLGMALVAWRPRPA
ncbi:MAG: DMT family transporter [Halobacteriales archaeon]|nr:DMT family transporter [Halobacteriales archaeon]